ncbi:hypothetical protein SDC9_174586 [bioreactor metagenome]|uniref:Uncharacterized protein n=1 Tax=bioreactor metagenome TaxID=1076179 RepID=A0A645GMQ5_9ZZZZ
MTAKDKQEIAEIVRAALEERGHCALGIKPETAHELISFADTWKHARRSALVVLVTVAIGGALGALWIGIKVMAKQ